MIRVLLEAPILTKSGYGEHSRLVYKALSERKDLEIMINPLKIMIQLHIELVEVL